VPIRQGMYLHPFKPYVNELTTSYAYLEVVPQGLKLSPRGEDPLFTHLFPNAHISRGNVYDPYVCM
jgi:hypothetical protein